MTLQNSRQTYYQFQGLEAWTNYSVKVSAFTSKGNGPYSASLLANTDEDGMLNNLIILKISVLTFFAKERVGFLKRLCRDSTDF